MNAKISESLGLMTITEAKNGELIVPDDSARPDHEDAVAEADRQYARENMKEIIETGTSAMTSVLDIAQATEDPRAFEVLSNIMKTLVDANKSLVGLNKDTGKKSSKSDKDSQDDNIKNVTNNNLFVGSTKDMMDIINKERK
ncbi:terminase small subunit [Sinorhizobium phage phiM7]|uniref:Terminase DNA packaging enzyme small subunit n=3 Tax=Emdodecavirus TaxID=1980937 RepID=S5MAU7_9CAUD|nr:terminase small subunit [Sinorhizobium phage phiM12]YP_009212338.1 terminase small subunit [Sinorhizobium phage phiN3]YP_009601208.1 terminase small subunit [Sinorhizobium phage phiM7]AKF12991.1 terminase small subunit [Sinorhizobium phage phiM19]AGR47748.1 terminase DNA packaging enzyme small subunit [Sinorhizobium phage phiM12]AKF12631.1 terminase small subunit [Sinorhizobium phage phiM7]AKF13362.1 terminase small subunit [Sinorhizobium phage phiN3]